MVKVSVIIPMYNTEFYILQCLKSVSCQTYSNLEIIVIDDGSTDRSVEICRELRLTDNRIQIFTQDNKGVSSARNRGLELASGEYVFFLDSDDAIHPCLIDYYVKYGETCDAELMFCTCVKMDTLEMEERICQTSKNTGEIQCKIGKKAEAKDWFYVKYEQELSCIGGKMIKRDFLGKQQFDEDIFSGEDIVFVHSLICRKVRMAYLDAEWYYYRMHTKSITHLSDWNKFWQKRKVSEIMRNKEYQAGYIYFALKWEEQLVWSILSNYLIAKTRKDKKNSEYLKKMMIIEMDHNLYKKLSGGIKLLFHLLFFGCSYFPPIRILWRIKQRFLKSSG